MEDKYHSCLLCNVVILFLGVEGIVVPDAKRGWLDGMNLYISMWLLRDDPLPLCCQGMGRAGASVRGVPARA